MDYAQDPLHDHEVRIKKLEEKVRELELLVMDYSQDTFHDHEKRIKKLEEKAKDLELLVKLLHVKYNNLCADSMIIT